MPISLQKGQKVSLSKESAGLSTVLIGLGWDEAKRILKSSAIAVTVKNLPLYFMNRVLEPALVLRQP